MTGEPAARKPSTSSGPLPPTHTVAPKSSRSGPERRCEVLIPQDGSGTKSGSAFRGGLARYGTPGNGPSAGPPGRAGRLVTGPGPDPLTTVTLTVWVEAPAAMWKSFT